MFIYEIKNKINSKRYIGQTTRNYESRWYEHLYKLRHNKHPNDKLQAAWNKYGESSFEFKVIKYCNTLEELNLFEQEYVSNNVNGYNLLGGGNNKVWSMESKLKLSLSKKGKSNGQKGSKRKSFSEDRKIRVSRQKKPKGYPDVVDPHGNIHAVTNVKEFARKHNLWFSGVASLFSDNHPCFHYKGWRVATTETIGVKFSYTTYSKSSRISAGRRPNGFPLLLNPSGEIFIIEDTLTSFCKQHQLSTGNISELINGKKTSYKGWTVYNHMEK